MNYSGILLLLTMPWLIALGASPAARAEANVTPDQVYSLTQRLQAEVELLKKHFEIDRDVVAPEFDLPLTPGHSWQKTYEILFKINILRQKYGLPFIAVPSREPREEPHPMLVYEQVRRLLTELDVLKFYLQIPGGTPPPREVNGKQPIDVFNLLNAISYQLDSLNGESFTPSHVFAQAIRISEDIKVLLEALGIHDDTISPPKQENTRPAEVYLVGLELLGEIQRINRLAGLPVLDIEAFRLPPPITPSEVFTLTGIILAELQPLKARLELKHTLTPIAGYYTHRIPADVRQVMGWALRKIKLIRQFR